MTLHYVMEMAVAGVVCVGKLTSRALAESIGEAVIEGLVELVKEPFRRRKRAQERTGNRRA